MREQHGPIQEQHGPVTGKLQLQRFGNYDLVRRIDVGGMGEVYLAHQRSAFGREVALKIIRSDLVHDVTARKRFLREAEVSAYLNHEHILPLVEFGEEQGRLFLVTPYIKGGTLARRLQQGPLSLDEVYQLFTALAQAVAYLHRRSVIHRDLKPSNVLLDRADDSDQIYVRLIDFGIASLQGSSASPPLTMAGHEMGTLAYMAPERANGIAAPSNDIYSLGVILYQMLTRRLPTASGTLEVLPPPLEEVVRRATASNPDARFSCAEDLLKAFEQAYLAAKSAAPPSEEEIATLPVQPTPAENQSPLPPPMAPAEPVTPARPVRPITMSKLPLHPLQAGAAQSSTASTFKRDSTSQPLKNTEAASTLPASTPQQAEFVVAAPSGTGRSFQAEDYNAPTMSLGHAKLQEKHLENSATATRIVNPPPQRKKPKRTLVATVSAGIVALILALIGLGFLAFQASVTASVTVSPQVKSIGKVFTITAKPNLQAADPASASIPASMLTSTQQASQQGKTSGTEGCVFILLGCKQSVSVLDVALQAEQLKPAVRAKIQQDLQHQAQASGSTMIGNINYTNDNVTSDPPIGSTSKTVTVTLSEQGAVEAVKAKDVHDMAQLLLKQQLEQNYVLIDQLTQVGQPVVQNVNLNGEVKIAVAAGGVARYVIPDTELANIQNHIKGMKQSAALDYLKQLPNLDPKSANVHVTYGDTIPNNVQQIKVVTVDPTNLPSVKLPPSPSGTPLAPNSTPTAGG